MVLDNYMHIQPSFLTIDEVNLIHDFANQQNEENASVGQDDNPIQNNEIRKTNLIEA